MALMLAVDAKRLGRLRKDAIWVALIAVSFVGWLVFTLKTSTGMSLNAQVVHEFGSRGPVIVERLIALLGFALQIWLHRKQQRGANLFSLTRPNGFVMGLGLIALGFLLSAGVSAALK